jgi:predicted phosphodiesterase
MRGPQPVITAVISDLHLGGQMSLLAVPHARRQLMLEVEGVDQVVLLGDVVGLREGRARDVLEAARPFFEELGTALEGRRIVIVPGNHDYQLVESLLDRARVEGRAGPLSLVWEIAPGAPGLLDLIARWTKRAEVLVAYPGVWIRPDVYATHGHYLDCHMTVPRPECLLAALMKGVVGGPPENGAMPQDYEAVLAPIYAFAYSYAQSAPLDGASGTVPAELWQRLKAHGRRRVRAAGRPGSGTALVGGALGLAVLATLNRAGVGPFKADLSPAELGRAGLAAMREVIGRLGVEADHVLFGHTHRPGPLEGEARWRLPGGAELINTGSWVYSPSLVGDRPGDSPYWPGTCAFVRDGGSPDLRGLLDDLRPTRATA